MAKEQLHGMEAERLYVIEQCTLAEIAERLGVCARTLQNWKTKGDWDVKRRNYLGSRSTFHEELYEFGKDLLGKIRRDMADDKEIPTGQLYALLRLLPNLIKVKDYEAVTTKAEHKDDPAKSLPPEIIALIEKEIGLTDDNGPA